jgi:hypothetical protein
MTSPDTDTDDIDPVTLLVPLVGALYARGVPHASDLLATVEGKALVDLLAPARAGAGTVHDRAVSAHRVVVAAVAAVGPPARHALEALLDLHPAATPGRRLVLTLTERRERAGGFYRVSGATVARHHEEKLTLALAMELQQRRAAADRTTRAADRRRPAAPPPPPASAYRPASGGPDRPVAAP